MFFSGLTTQFAGNAVEN